MARMTPKERKAHILASALIVAQRETLTRMSCVNVAEQGDFTPGLVNQHFGSLAGLRKAVHAAAKRQGLTVGEMPSKPRAARRVV